ncbi:hypothetical protein BGZ94_006661 [Podila epigama]|nr:hypothetical protein BGZ94_006661 [Podila epigama]
MTFSLSSPELVNLTQYQQTLRKLITVLASLKNGFQQHQHRLQEKERPVLSFPTLKRIVTGSGGEFIVDTSLLQALKAGGGVGGGGSQEQAEQSGVEYPLSFFAASPVPELNPTSYHLQLPFNPLTHPIRCHLSARRLCTRQVTILDQILRRLCDASPGAFQLCYSDGLSGLDAGAEVVYSGKGSTHNSTTGVTSTSSTDADVATLKATNHKAEHDLAKSHALTRGGGFQEQGQKLSEQTDEQVVDDLAIATAPQSRPEVSYMEDVKKTESMIVTKAVHKDGEERALSPSMDVQMDDEGDNDLLQYDFGQLDDIDQLIDVAPSVDIEELHDMLWM